MNINNSTARYVGVSFSTLLIASALVGFASTSPLNEQSAKSLIETTLKPRNYYVEGKELFESMGQSMTDYTKTPISKNARIISRFIAAGLVEQQEFKVPYPIITGRWSVDLHHDSLNKAFIYTESYVLDLEMKPGTNEFSGEAVVTRRGPQTRHSSMKKHESHDVMGYIRSNGSLEFTDLLDHSSVLYCGSTTCLVSRNTDFKLVDDGNRTLIKVSYGRNWKAGYRGKKHGTVDLTRYSYSFSPKLGAFSEKIPVGSIIVNDVRHLRLANETNATAKFSWTVRLNEAGRILLNGKAPSGVGSAAFGKKPDGTWALNSLPRL